MKTDKIIVNLSNLENIETYKEVGITNFLFPLEGYSVGFNTFTLEEISKTGIRAYLLVNRLLTDADIDAFLKLDIPSSVAGIFVEDTGLYYALKNRNLELINFQNHLNNNYKTVNYWLKHFDSLVLSTDISLEEGKVIVDRAIKPLVVYSFGYPMIMYSRRHLLKNYYTYSKKSPKKKETISIPNNEESFILKESEYGTAVFTNHILDARLETSSYPEEKIKFYIFDENMIESKIVLDALKDTKDIEGTNKGFLYKKTVYRIGDIK